MGNAESSSGSSAPLHKVGYHVLQVQAGSPSSDVLFPFWDIIVGSRDTLFDKEDARLVDLFHSSVNQPLNLHVYNLRTDRHREVTITPNANWGGTGLVGISIRFCKFDNILELVWHVLDVYVDSPASDAKLMTRTDYIIGVPDKLFNDPEDFFNHINSHMRQPIQLYVYNSLTEDVRVVQITPNSDWGGSGSLGCDIGYGYLHRIPTRSTATPRASPASSTNNSPRPPSIPAAAIPPVHSPSSSLPSPNPSGSAAGAVPPLTFPYTSNMTPSKPPPPYSSTYTAPSSHIFTPSPTSGVYAHYAPTYPMSPYGSPLPATGTAASTVPPYTTTAPYLSSSALPLPPTSGIFSGASSFLSSTSPSFLSSPSSSSSSLFSPSTTPLFSTTALPAVSAGSSSFPLSSFTPSPLPSASSTSPQPAVMTPIPESEQPPLEQVHL